MSPNCKGEAVHICIGNGVGSDWFSENMMLAIGLLQQTGGGRD